MIRSHGARAALCAVLAIALAGCIENRYRSDDGGAVVVNDTAPGGSPDAKTTSSPSGPTGQAPAMAHQGRAEAEGYTLDGYRVYADDGRLWVFEAGSDALESYLEKGEPAKRVTLIGEGPDGKTLLGSDAHVMRNYADCTRFRLPGYAVVGHDGRLWVFKRGSAAHKSFESKGEPAKRVTLVSAGPEGKTLMGSDKQVLEDFAASHKYAAPGFVVIGDDGRLWVFRRGSENLASFIEKGEPAKRVTLIAAGPDGKTLMGSDAEAMKQYAKAVAN